MGPRLIVRCGEQGERFDVTALAICFFVLLLGVFWQGFGNLKGFGNMFGIPMFKDFLGFETIVCFCLCGK